MSHTVMTCTRKRCKNWWFDEQETSGMSILWWPRYLSCKYRVCPLRNQIAEARALRHSALASGVAMEPAEVRDGRDG